VNGKNIKRNGSRFSSTLYLPFLYFLSLLGVNFLRSLARRREKQAHMGDLVSSIDTVFINSVITYKVNFAAFDRTSFRTMTSTPYGETCLC